MIDVMWFFILGVQVIEKTLKINTRMYTLKIALKNMDYLVVEKRPNR